MSDSKVVFIPSMSLTYEDNMLETVGIGGELYRRDTPLIAENSVLKAENDKLREFAKNAYKHICAQEGYLRGSGYDSFDYFDTMARELGIEVGE